MPIIPRLWCDWFAWWVWLLVVCVMLLSPWHLAVLHPSTQPALLPAVLPSVEADALILWQSPFDAWPWFSRRLRWRWRMAWHQVQTWFTTVRTWLLLLVRLWGCRTLAEVIQVLTRRTVVRYLGALPVLYPLLERLQVRAIINRYCSTESPVDHGTVALVLILNRLIAPRPLYRVLDWLASTVLCDYLGVPASKFNDDRLGRTLDALAEQAQAIWQDIASQALLHFQIDLSVLFYDLTALVLTGEYHESKWAGYGFAHNTPADEQKFKVGMVATADGGIPCLFQPWAARTADKATVQKNMTALQTLLNRQGWDTQRVLIVGDSANLNSELALAYAAAHLKYLAGLPLLEKPHRALVLTPTDAELERLPLTQDHGPRGYWGWVCPVPFAHGGRKVLHRGLVILSGPMRTSLRRQRAEDFQSLFAALRQVQTKVGQKRYRTVREVQARAETQLRHSAVGKLVHVEATPTAEGGVALRWWIDREALGAAMRADGRYLLVTNDPNLTPVQMLARYREKDVLEKRFRVFKQDLRVRPLFVHSDERLQGMLLVNLIALLAYSLLERQARQQGLCLTAHRILEQLSNLQIIEIEAWDGSRTQRWDALTPAHRNLVWTLWQGLGYRPPMFTPNLTTVRLRAHGEAWWLGRVQAPFQLPLSDPPVFAPAR